MRGLTAVVHKGFVFAPKEHEILAGGATAGTVSLPPLAPAGAPESRRARWGFSVILLGFLTSPIFAQITIERANLELKFPEYQSAAFPNYTTVLVPSTNLRKIELFLRDCLAEVQVSTVRVKLNGHPISMLLNLNPLPRGVRVIVDLGLSTNPEFKIKAEGYNQIDFEALDDSRNKYLGQFFIKVDPKVQRPQSAPMPPTPDQPTRKSPKPEPPQIQIDASLPRETEQERITLLATVSDPIGLKRVTLEVNEKDSQEAFFDRGKLVRVRRGFWEGAKPPGSISGDEQSLKLEIPIKLKKGQNTIVIRAENSAGLRSREERTIERAKQRR